jgi:hypothetical protein
MLNSLRCIALTLPLLVPGVACAEVKIPAACRVKNRPPGRCGWCALETLARHLGLKAMYGLTEKHPSTCSPRSLEDCLTKAGIPYRIQYPGRHREEILRYAIRADLGAAIGLREPYPGADKHIVTLVDLDEDTVKVIDPNDADGRTRQMSLARFLRWWDGFALVLEPESCWVWRTAEDQPRCGGVARYGEFGAGCLRDATFGGLDHLLVPRCTGGQEIDSLYPLSILTRAPIRFPFALPRACASHSDRRPCFWTGRASQSTTGPSGGCPPFRNVSRLKG